MFHMQWLHLSTCSSFLFLPHSIFFSMELFRHSPSVWTRAHVSNELAERQRLWGEIHLAHTHMLSLTGPRKVMLNSIRHHERLMMLRGPHLTWDPVKLCLVVRCTCIDSSSVRGLIEWGGFFPSFFLMKLVPLMKTNRILDVFLY